MKSGCLGVRTLVLERNLGKGGFLRTEISSWASWSFLMSRATMITLAPFFARRHPALLPSPADPPVMRTVYAFH